jgi:pimeloyl-ACP methyl ester carboxylesterase
MVKHSLIAEDKVRIGVIEWRPDKKRYPYPILLIHGYAQNNLSWHGKSGGMAPELSKRGFHVFAVDLRGSGFSRLGKIRYSYTFEDFVFKDIDTAVSFIKARSLSPKVILAGHSLGGICSYAYTSWKQENVFSVITFGSPVFFGKGVPAMQIFGKIVGFAKNIPLSHLVYFFWPREVFMKVLGFFGLFGVPLMRYSYILKVAPLYPSYTRNFESLYDFWEKLVLGFEQTSPRLLVQLLLWVYERKITSYDGTIDFTEEFKKINVPIFAIAGNLDKLAPPESVKPILDIVSSEKKFYKEYEAGHLDLIEGKLAKSQIVDDIEDFLRKIKD